MKNAYIVILILLSFMLIIDSKNSYGQANCGGVNLLTDPSFESIIIVGPTQNFSNTLGNWRSNVNIQIVRPDGPSPQWPSTGADGEQFIDLNNSTGAGWIEQEFTLEDATQLHFSGSFSNRQTGVPGYQGGQIAIQILSTDATPVTFAAESGTLDAASGYNWVTINALTNVLNPGTYRFRAFSTTNYAHFDNFVVCKSTDATQACPSPTVLKPESSWSASASSQLVGYEASRAIDGSLREAATGRNVWAGGSPSGSINQFITFDYGKVLDLVGFVYYPRTEVSQDISKYTIEVSNDGTTFTEVQTGSIRKQNNYTTATYLPTGEPLEVHFQESVTARYMRFVVKGMYQTGYAAIAEMLPIVCGGTTLDNVISCSNANLLNTGTDAEGTGTKVLDTFDTNWEVAFVQGKGATYTNLLPELSSIENLVFKPAIVTGNKIPTAWANSPYGNAQWISYTTSSRDVYGIANEPQFQNSYFFRYRFKIEDAYLLPAFKLRLNFLTDNTVKNIYINGNALAGELGLPSGGFRLTDQTITALNKHWELGENEIVIQVYSQPTYAGFLGQNITSCPGIDFGDAPASYNVSRQTFGAGHLIETNAEGEVLLTLGDLVDAEADGIASSANSDDQNDDTNDEDGISDFPGVPKGDNPTVESYTLAVKVTNISGVPANLCGWIDWNGNGVFDESERVCTTVPDGATTATLVWPTTTFNSTAFSGGTYMRFRITTDELSNPNGAASNGEVEDYFVTFTPLPVKLEGIKAIQEQNAINVSWTTTQEVNAASFDVERSQDGKKWISLGRVEAFGESTTNRNYSFVDNTALNGSNIYRLKMIDRDATYEYSRLVSADYTGASVFIYPNPVSSRLTVNKLDQVHSVTLYNMAGTQVLRTANVTASGIDVSKIPEGVYLVKIKYHNNTEKTDKIVITK